MSQSVARPPRRLPGAGLLAFQRDPVGVLSTLAARHGDIVSFRLGPQPTVLVVHPDQIREVLVTHSKLFSKGRALQRTKRLLGDGLLTSEGAHHLRQRRLAQPAFHRQRIAAYARDMVELSEAHTAGWADGQLVDINAEMMRLTLQIVGRTLFGAEMADAAAGVYAAMDDLMRLFVLAPLPFIDQIERLPLPINRRFERARDQLDRVIYGMIAARRAGDMAGDDLLSLLLMAQDHEGDGGGMSDEQLRDEALTIFLAGHETTANALSWTFYLLSQHPPVAERLRAELEQALGGRAPALEDLPRLRYAEMVFAEAMRLYPPAWILGRLAQAPFELGGQRFPAGTTVIMSQWVTHHDARFFPDPYRFDPERFAPAARAARPRFAYFPFGGGPRQCIGESFAWMEGTLLLAAIARHWQPLLLPGHPVALQPSITLRPRHGLRTRLCRAPGAAVAGPGVV